jgi:predicted ATPase
LGIRYEAFEDPISAAMLSDGTLAYLCFVALARSVTDRPVLALDEPEAHLHPALLARVVNLLEVASSECPVIVATHSDRFLDALNDPGRGVVLCELDALRKTHLKHPNTDELALWLGEYGGYGSIRAAGLEPLVTTEELS